MKNKDKYFNACGCGGSANFSGEHFNASGFVADEDDVQDLYFEGDVEDGEGEEFDNFLSKKMRERRKIRKELIESGIDPKEAKVKALEQVPKDKLKDVLARIKKGKDKLEDSVGDIDIPSGTTSGSGTTVGTGGAIMGSSEDGGTPPKTAGFGCKNMLWIGIGAVVIIGGYFAWKKFGKGK